VENEGSAFLYYYLSSDRGQIQLRQKLRSLLGDSSEDGETLDLYVVASLAGGTGSGLLLPITLYLRRLLKNEYNVTNINAKAILALPDVCEAMLTAEQQIKARANAYAAVRELNGMTANAFGKANISFKLGDETDKILGLLYDSDSPESKTEEAAPFSEICLFKRIPCVNTVSIHVEYVSDAITSLFAEETSNTKNTSAPYGTISVSKTVYPEEALEKYITNAYVNILESQRWLVFEKELLKELEKKRSSVRFSSNNTPSDAEQLAEAVNNVAHGLYERSERTEALLGRSQDDDSDDVLSADELFGKAFAEEIDSFLDEELSELGANTIDRRIEQHKNEMKSKPKDPLFISSDRKKKNVTFALECGSETKRFYESCREEQDSSALTDELFGTETELSIYERLFKLEGEYLHPTIVITRLCGLYSELKNFVNKCKTRIRELNTEEIPHWVTCVDTEMQGNCTYDTGESDRFEKLIAGDAAHVGGRIADRGLIIFDLESATLRIKYAFKCRRLAKVIETLESIITSYHNIFTALSSVSDAHNEQVNELLYSYISRPGVINFVGTTAEEKTHLFDKYSAFMTEHDPSAQQDKALSSLLGGKFAELLSVSNDNEDVTVGHLEDFIAKAVNILSGNELTKDFVNRYIKKNVLQVLMTSDGNNGSDKSELALSKAFCAASDALRLVAPDSSSAYLVMQSVKRDVRAILPIEARNYIACTSGEDSIDNIMNGILYSAGEYDAKFSFSPALPSNELRMTRHTTGIRLSLLEPFNEDSELPIYRKAYLSSLRMKEHYMTDMWDPHIIVGVSDTDLPLLGE
jgi:hypothetical protein